MAVDNFWDTAEQAFLSHLLRGVTAPDWTPVKVSLHTANPGSSGAHEVTGGSYARVQVNTDKWTVPVGIGAGSASYNTDNLVFTSMPETSVTYVGLWSNDGTVFIMSSPFDVSQSVSAGATYTILAGRLRVVQN